MRNCSEIFHATNVYLVYRFDKVSPKFSKWDLAIISKPLLHKNKAVQGLLHKIFAGILDMNSNDFMQSKNPLLLAKSFPRKCLQLPLKPAKQGFTFQSDAIKTTWYYLYNVLCIYKVQFSSDFKQSIKIMVFQ